MGKIKNFLSKNWLWIVIAIVIIGYGKTVMRAFSPGGIFSQDNNKARKEEMVSDLNAVKVDQAKMSKTLVAIKTVADTLHNAMANPGVTGFGTDEDRIFSELKGLNTEDLKALYKAFGIRDDSFFGITVKSGNLFDWFQDELSNADYEKIKSIFSKTGLI